jgi:CheY-like chemotaxis protein
MVSHELRTPLNAILGWTSIMQNHKGDEHVAAKATHAIDRSGRTQARLIDELLDVSRIVSGQLLLNPVAPASVTATVEAALDAVRPSTDAKQLEIVRRFSDDVPIVTGDAERLLQIVGNLLSNAVRFTPEGGRIEVGVGVVSGMVEIRVSDNGIGIPPEFLPYVFERFRQADSSTTRAHGGLGLGLSIVRHLVELHGGTVEAFSDGPGQGSTFIVRLPEASAAVVPDAPLPDRTPDLVHLSLLKGRRVLVVDDDAEARGVLKAILEDAGASVAAMASADEMRAFLEHATTDLLIADIGMPQEDGYSLIRSVRSQPAAELARLPAIALTAHTRPEDVQQALASGFQMHIAKPVDPSRLISAVTATLETQALAS